MNDTDDPARIEQLVAERTAGLLANRDRLNQFFAVLASLHQPDNIEKAFDLVLHFCRQLGYHTAMLSLVDREAGVIRAVKAVGPQEKIVGQTVRPLGSDDILAVVVREARTVVVADATADPRCDAAAARAAEVRGLIVVPLVAGEVVGTLQVASREPIEAKPQEVRALEALAGESARALVVLRYVGRIRELNRELERRNRQLEQLAEDLEEIAAAERKTREALWTSQETLQRQNVLLQEAVQSERRAHEELKRAQSQLVQAEKLAALGQLVAGVAHEINNPLSFVSNNVAVLQRDVAALRDVLELYRGVEPALAELRPDLHARLRDLADSIDLQYTLDNLGPLMSRSRDGLKRIQQIVKDLRDFARLDESDQQEVDLNAGIESTINIIRSRAKKQQVELVLELAPLPPVSCYPAKVNQVVLNLVANAIDACDAGGRVTVRTAAADSGVAVHVVDTGRGIPAAIRARVFDPFFTTKPPGQGMGLGLSISYRIVEDHGGRIDFESAPGQGTHFVVHLPRKAARTGRG